MFQPKNNSTEFNFWPSIADTLLAIFMVFLMLWLAEKLIFLRELGHVQAGNEALTQKFEKLDEKCAKSEADLKNAEEIIVKEELNTQALMLDLQKCEGKNQACEQEKAELSSDLQKCEQQQTQLALKNYESDKTQYLRDEPPIINLPETLGFSFNSGQAQLSEGFENLLKKDVVPKLIEIKNRHNVNVIEIIGHTDGVMAGGKSNLDEKLENAVENSNISGLHYGSNVDLGLMRALTVAFFLQKQSQLKGVKFRVYSAAQLILPDGQLADKPDREENKARRRIELRFTHLGN